MAHAYTHMLVSDTHNGQTYNLMGQATSQAQLAELVNQVFGTKLRFNAISIDDYLAERIAELGDFIGTVIAGIYEGIRNGVNDVPSDFEKVTGRLHMSPLDMIEAFKN
ncbi:MAG: hypothetical protein ABJG41_15990 [Cyclobacteriaceae bacterium]